MTRISDDFLISSIIKLYNDAGKPIWFNKLEKLLEGRMSRATISRNIDKLFDYGIINGTWEKNSDGSWIRAFTIAGEATLLVDKICKEKAVEDDSFRKISAHIE